MKFSSDKERGEMSLNHAGNSVVRPGDSTPLRSQDAQPQQPLEECPNCHEKSIQQREDDALGTYLLCRKCGWWNTQ